MKPEMIPVFENKRTYIFADGRDVELEHVTAICIRPSGSHRVETASGKKYIISPGWLAIEIETDEWAF